MARLLALLLLSAALAGAEPTLAELERDLHEAEAVATQAKARAEAWQLLVAAADPAVATARTALAAAEAARDARPEQQALRAARDRRDALALTVARAGERFTALELRIATLQGEVDALLARGTAPDDAGLDALATARRTLTSLQRQRDAALRACWKRTPVLEAWTEADRAYQAAAKAGKDAAIESARAARAAAETAVGGERATTLAAARAAAEAAAAEARAALAEARRIALAGRTWSIRFPLPPGRDGKPRTGGATLWAPAGEAPIRGFLAGHPPGLGTGILDDPALRALCVEQRLATIAFDLDALFTVASGAPERFQAALAQLAEASGIAGLPALPFVGVGHSTSGIWARNLAYWAPDRALAVIHLKSGNLHQHRADPAQALTGVPFLAVNGEYEEFGPEGGLKGGIQPAYGAQTQWVLIREQLLRWRRADPQHLVALAVNAGGGHGDWNAELSALVATWLREVCVRRLPATPGAPLVVLRAEDGWLVDADLTAPRHPPAAWADYAGDRTEAFWLPGAAPVAPFTALHGERLILEDPTRATPVPASWPAGVIR